MNTGVRGVFIVFSATIINTVFNGLTNFVLPAFLSVQTYANIKTYLLYLTYVGLLHIGYLDGMYLKYGGKKLAEIDSIDLRNDLHTLQTFQFIVCGALVIFGILCGNTVFIFAAFSAFPINIASYYKMLYQASGEFKTYSNILRLTTTLSFLCNMVLLFLVRTDKYQVYLICYFFVYCIIWFVVAKRAPEKTTLDSKGIFHISILRQNISGGILLLFGNFGTIILTGMDQWFVKFLLDTTAFAQYSFAASMLGLLHIATTPVGTVLYNWFCHEKSDEKIRQVGNLVALMGAAIISLAFPAKFFLEHFLKKYIASNTIIFFLFGAQLLAIIVGCVYTNLYKAQKKQKRYFVKLVINLALGFLLNIICFSIFPQKESFAIATLLTYIIWFFMVYHDFAKMSFNVLGIVFIFVEIGWFIFCGVYMEVVIGFCFYMTGSILFGCLFMSRDIKFLGKKLQLFLQQKKSSTS